MNQLSAFFVKAKAWHVFSLFVGITILSPILTLKLHLPLGLSKAFISLHVLFMLIWLYALGIKLYSLVPQLASTKLALFKTSTILTSVCLYLFVFLYFGPEMTSGPAVLLVIFINLGFIYSTYFVAKSLVNAEFQIKSTFHSAGSALILIWLFPVGIWFIQPRLQKVFAEIA